MPVGLYQHSNVSQILPKVPVFPWKAEVGITSAYSLNMVRISQPVQVLHSN